MTVSEMDSGGQRSTRFDCGSAVEVSGREAEIWAAELAAAHGFSDVYHTIELFGTARTAAVEHQL
jgi:Fe2+ or Zn2+ uptake regulation protein